MEEKTKTIVRIYGADYTLVGTESEEYIQKVCLHVDKKMREVGLGTPLSTAKVSVLAAINMSDEYHKTKALLEDTQAELKKYKEDSVQTRGEAKALKEENAYLRDEVQRLKIELAKKGN